MINSFMPTRWKLKEFLQEHDISPYALSQQTTGKLSMKSVYNLVADTPPTNIRTTTFDALIPALEQLTGKHVDITDLLAYERTN